MFGVLLFFKESKNLPCLLLQSVLNLPGSYRWDTGGFGGLGPGTLRSSLLKS